MQRARLAILWISLLGCMLVVSSLPALAQTITRGPYLQRGSKDFVIVRWRTDATITPVVKVGRTVGSETDSYSGASGTEHRIEIFGLLPSTKYFYKIMAGSTLLAGGDESHSFVTSPNGGDEPFTVWALGDSGISATLGSGEHPNQAAVRDAFLNVVPLKDIAFLMHLGDIAYYEGTDTQFQRGFFDIYPSILRTLTSWPTQGNHDMSANAYYDTFSLPQLAQAGGVASNSERYYSWDYGNVHFISLNSERTSSRAAMETWLRDDLSANTKPWQIAIFHHPPYTKGSHDSDNVADSSGKMNYMRETILPILEQYGVDLVMSGHSHSYERSYLLNGHYGLSSTFLDAYKISPTSGRDAQAYTKTTLAPRANSGTVYVVAGSGGMLDASGTLAHPAMFNSQATLGSVALDVNANELHVRFVTSAATVGDYFTIRKDPTLPRKPTSVDVAPGTGCGLRIQWNAASAATSYAVYRSDQERTRGTLIASGITDTAFTDPSPARGVTHYYSVRGSNAHGYGPWADTDSGVAPSLDSDGDGIRDCADECPNDPESFVPSPCGCGLNIDSDKDGALNCVDQCPTNPDVILPGPCRCDQEPLGTFPDGTTNCSSTVSPNRLPSAPKVVRTGKFLRVTMDAYEKGVKGYTIVISQRGRVVKRMAAKKSLARISNEWRNPISVRYQIHFTTGSAKGTTRLSRATRID
jgi:hypothetical protein